MTFRVINGKILSDIFIRRNLFMSEKIRLKIRSVLYEVEASLFSNEEENEALEELMPMEAEIAPDELIINSEGLLNTENGRFEISYTESEATGMEGATTSISFFNDQPEIISMVRSGSVSTALVFEERKRHHCLYNTPYMPFEVCVHTLLVENRLIEDGTLKLDYVVEIRGAQAERTKLDVQILK